MTNGISVIIPCYQEADNLKTLLPFLNETLSCLSIPYEVLCVDTMEVMDESEQICHKNNCAYVKRQDGNNYGDAIRTGFAKVKYNFTVVMDGDGSHNPKYIIDFYNKINSDENYDLIIGSRYTKGGGTHNSFLLRSMSYILNFTYRILFNIKAKDISDSFRMYRTEQIQSIKLECDNFDVVEEILIKLSMQKKNFKLFEIPIYFEKRQEGKSKRKLGKFIMSYLSTIRKLKKIQKKEKET